jgi:hypothetical protein
MMIRLTRTGSLAQVGANCQWPAPLVGPVLLLDKTMKTTWIVCWHGIEEECSCLQDAVDRWDQLDDHGIKAEVFEVFAGERRRRRMCL